MRPKLNLQVRNSLDVFLHLLKQPFKLDHISQLRVDLFVIQMILLDVILNYVLVSEYGELLLKRRLLLLSNI